MAKAPAICPRCGDKKFTATKEWRNTSRLEKTLVTKYSCTTCHLAFLGDHWEDMTGEDWIMAESGT